MFVECPACDCRFVRMDPLLASLLLRKDEAKDMLLPREALTERLLPKLLCYYALYHKEDPNGATIRYPRSHSHPLPSAHSRRKGTLRTIQIITERRQGKKVVTRILFLEQYEMVDVEALAKELQKKCACSTAGMILFVDGGGG